MSKSLNLYGGTAIGTVVALTLAYNFADRNVTGMPEDASFVSAELDPDFGLIAAATAADASAEGPLGLGRPALPEEVAAWNLDVHPDGSGLPPGSGSVEDGDMLFAENCAMCHGDFAEGVDNWPKLAGGFDTLADEDPVKTVGSYWPYLSTAWDYVHRSMPFGNAQSLSNDDVYAIVAYILYSNDLVDGDFVLTNENFLEVEMPNAGNFVIDDRPETEYPIFSGEPCMEDCKDSVEITMRATVLDVTPDEATEEAAAPAAEPAEVQVAETATDEPAAEPVAAAPASVDPELVAAGEKVFKKCKACHQVGDGAQNKTGPHLNGLLGRAIGSSDGFRYSKGFEALAAEGKVWDAETLAAFLTDPKGYVSGTKMSFRGLNKEADIQAVTAYLSTFSE